MDFLSSSEDLPVFVQESLQNGKSSEVKHKTFVYKDKSIDAEYEFLAVKLIKESHCLKGKS
ncbi:hypothetical protein MTsPCn9_09420 [Croceitalea sp. MTPC9]|uniref:hypothetical protein n=1 Tax=unclassified Croceitalea TaxID=2632280 RepID=UPI002B3E816D|nr:hypothetical protein MTsPCn6_27820 [Croceitalea sp. MTPC6]GMN16006.1 hypothetical protein MTsPCn9_09420 [Croceitalea sp. MTPC9]